MRITAVFTLAASLLAAGAVAATGGSKTGSVDLAAARGKTTGASSVHYSVAVRMTKHDHPVTLHIAGGSSKDRLSVRLRLNDLTLRDGTKLPGITGAVLMNKPFVYEKAPSGLAVGGLQWLRLTLGHVSSRSQVMRALQALTPAPLLRVVAEAKLRPTGTSGGFAGPVAYDDPVVRTALHTLAGGIEFRRLRVFVHVGRDGWIHSLRITGRTADHATKLALHAFLYGFDAPVRVVPPKPGAFMDQRLSQLQA